MKQFIFGATLVIGIIIGGYMTGIIFFGVLMLLGIIAIVESIPVLRWICERMPSFLDVIITGASIISIATLGLTVAGSLSIAAFGWTMVYAPWLRQRYQLRKFKSNH